MIPFPRHTVTITGRFAEQIADDTARLVPTTGVWHEVAYVKDCQAECKGHARRTPTETVWAVLHSTAYGCPLGRHADTWQVPVVLQLTAPRDPRGCGTCGWTPSDTNERVIGACVPNYHELGLVNVEDPTPPRDVWSDDPDRTTRRGLVA